MKRVTIGLFGLTLVLAACGVGGGGTTASTTAPTATTASPTTTAAATTTTVRPTTSTTAATATTTTASTTTTRATTTTASATTSTTAAATTTTTSATTTTAGGSTVTIAADSFSFSPATVTIKVGDKVQWVLRGGSHTTTSGTAPTQDGLWNQVITADAPVTITFDQAGQFSFFCRFHPDSMQGTVVVQP